MDDFEGVDMPKSTCTIDGCDRKMSARGWCNAHYMRWLNGRPVEGPIRPQYDPICTAPGCERPHKVHGYCELHADRMKRSGSIEKPIKPAGERHPCWVGDAVSYNALHRRIRNALGSASLYECTDCSERAKDWAYDHEDPNERIDPDAGFPYSTDFAHYRPLCRACHMTFDLAIKAGCS